MEEVINKTDGQFKNILDDLVDYNKHASQKDPIIKKLNSNPAASLNSSTYSSAASSASSSSSTSSSSSSSSSSASSSSSTSSTLDPSNSPTSSALPSTSTSPSQNQHLKNDISRGGEEEFEIARLEDLGRTAKILEHHKIRSKSSPSTTTTTTASTATITTTTTTTTPITNKNQNSQATASNADFGRLLHHLGDKVNVKNFNQNGITAAPLQTISHNYTNNTNSVDVRSSSQPDSVDSNTNVSSWKTISARRDKRKKKAVEIKIFAEHIPGNRGNATIDELTKFIESGTTNVASNPSGRVNKGKQQTGSSSISNSNNHTNSGNNQSSNITSSTTNNSTKSLTNNNALNNINSSSSNTTIKKNDSHLAAIKKTNMVAPKMSSNNVVQIKNPPMQKTSVTTNQSATTRNSQPRSKQSQLNEQNRESLNQKNTNKVPQAPQQLSKSLSEPTPKQPSLIQRCTEPSNQASEQQAVPEGSAEQNLGESQKEAAVTFAHHLPIFDDDVRQYTFGFFEEQPNQTQHTKASIANRTILIDKNVIVNDPTKQSSPSQQSPIEQPKVYPKQPKASPNSEEECFKSNDKIDATSFNYDQILKFISNRWVEAKKSATAS